MSDKPLPNIIQLTPINPEFNADPRVLLDRLRNECPVMRDDAAGAFLLTRYCDVRAVVSDTSLWRNPNRAEEAAVSQKSFTDRPVPGMTVPADEFGTRIILLDDPDHSRIRNPLAKAFYKRVANSKALVQRVVDEQLDRLATKKHFDAISDFALPIPIDVLARILGVDDARLAEFREWSEGSILALNPFRDEQQSKFYVDSSNALSAYMRSLIAERRAEPRDDLVSDMVALAAAGEPITDGEISANLQGLLVAGNLTTTDLIGSAIWLLLKNPDELAKLKADPSLIVRAVEEVLRYESPVDITARVASRDMDIGGCPVKQTQAIVTSLRSANRDPEAFPDPHRFDITRKVASNVSFGGGAHICLGAPLARIEAQLAVQSFFARLPNARLSDPAAPMRWRDLPFFRGLKELQVDI